MVLSKLYHNDLIPQTSNPKANGPVTKKKKTSLAAPHKEKEICLASEEIATNENY